MILPLEACFELHALFSIFSKQMTANKVLILEINSLVEECFSCNFDRN